MGELLTAKNQNSSLVFAYDNLGNVVSETQNGHTVESGYSKDNIGVLTSLKTSLGLNMDIGLNGFGQAESITASMGDSVYKCGMAYNAIGQMTERTVETANNGGIVDTWGYDNAGRPTQQTLRISHRESSNRQYKWENGDQIKSIIDSISNMGAEYSYGKHGNAEVESFKTPKLIAKRPGNAQTTTIRYLDETGKEYEFRSKMDKKYTPGGQLISSGMRKYEYNDCGDLFKKTERDGKVWVYVYTVGGLLEKVIRPDMKEATFLYDPLGRRISKTFDGKTTKYLWNGNTVIHEWVEQEGDASTEETQPQNVQTWLYEDGTFTPIAKLTEKGSYAVITDHLGTPKELVDQQGNVVWRATLDLYGMVRYKEGGETEETNCNIRFPGQHEDEETGLYYNRFRYYLPSEGIYTQRDPIGLAGGNPTVYGYVWSTLTCVDPLGLLGYWGRRLNRAGLQRPSGMIRPHGHHIVFQGALVGTHNIEMRNVLNQSRGVLNRFRIDPVNDLAGLMWAPNRGHTLATATQVRNGLLEAESVIRSAVARGEINLNNPSDFINAREFMRERLQGIGQDVFGCR